VSTIEQRDDHYRVFVFHSDADIDDLSVLRFPLHERVVVEPLREEDTLTFTGRLTEARYVMSTDQVPSGFYVDSVTIEGRGAGDAGG
jgi:hypothetical protein